MQRRRLEQLHIHLDSGCSYSALEREYWRALEVQAYEYGSNTCAFPSASRLRKMVTVFLLDEFDERRSSDRVD